MSKIFCIYHDHCTDGFAAAWAVRSALGDDAEYFPASYGQEPPDVAGREVLLADFSYPRTAIEEMMQSAKSLLILDHHKTALSDLRDLTPPPGYEAWRTIRGDEPVSARISAIFDMNRSGAGIAWDYFRRTNRPWMLNLIETRDLWRQGDARWPDARKLHAYLNSYDFDFSAWDETVSLTTFVEGRDMVLGEGGAILRQADRQVAELVSITKRQMRIGNVEVPVACLAPWMASDGCHLMGLDEPFAASYYDNSKIRAFSLRSRPDGMDVSEIAKLYGGGGHKHAAGFAVPREHDLACA